MDNFWNCTICQSTQTYIIKLEEKGTFLANAGCSTRKFQVSLSNQKKQVRALKSKKWSCHRGLISCLATARQKLQAQSGLINQNLLSTGTYSSKMNTGLLESLWEGRGGT